jgi:hypothetical protein
MGGMGARQEAGPQAFHPQPPQGQQGGAGQHFCQQWPFSDYRGLSREEKQALRE